MNYSELSRPLGGRASFVYSDSLISDCGNLKHSEMFGSNFSQHRANNMFELNIQFMSSGQMVGLN